VLVEFVRFEQFDFSAVHARGEEPRGPDRYLAFVLQADALSAVDLGEADRIDFLIAAFRAALTGTPAPLRPGGTARTAAVAYGETDLRSTVRAAARHLGEVARSTDSTEARRLGAELRAALFDPLVPHLVGRTWLILSPDGELNRLPFEVLPDADGGYLIDRFRLSYLSAARDLLSFQSPGKGSEGVSLVVADPDFNLRADGSPLVQMNKPFPRLKGTLAEGMKVAKLLGTEPQFQAQALKARLRACRAPRILHIATHGYFQEDTPISRGGLATVRRTGSGFLGSLRNPWGRVANPLLRSGLALAGANAWVQGASLPPNAENGILTAEDVTGMDLSGTDLVVLSACETGLGEVHASEGVYGLRRAFVVAGAKTLVMSLWKIPDHHTQELMTEFYQRLLHGEPRAEALRQAQLALKERYPHPYYWGAFICQGDPRPLALTRDTI
jgi:CHAT domain-containing protein